MAGSIASFHQILESKLSTFAIKNGQVILCADTGNLYIDTSATERVQTSVNIISLATEAAREALLTPISGKFYCCMDSGKMYTYTDTWVSISKPAVNLRNVMLLKTGWTTVSANNHTYTITDASIKSFHVGMLEPELSIIDLFTTYGISIASIGNGSLVIKATSKPAYDLWCNINLI